MLLWLLRLLIGAALLSYSAWRDWRTRAVSNMPWAIMGTAGILLLGVETLEVAQSSLVALILVPPALLLLDALWEREETLRWKGLAFSIYVASVAIVIVLLFSFGNFSPEEQVLLRRGFGVLVVILLAYLFYYFGLLRGGADAKAFISIGILVPGYPNWSVFPLVSIDPVLLGAFELLFPFALATLMNAALLLLTLPLSFLIVNLLRGDFRWPQVVLGYKEPIDDLPPFVWILQEARGDRVTYYVFPKKEPKDADLGGLKQLGIEKVWVTPQVPFLIPLTVGFVITFIVGNLLFALF